MMRFQRIFASIALALGMAITPTASFAQVSIGVGFNIGTPPPALPVYVQPPCPTAGYLWTPGYWSYGAYGYYWVPGTWIAPPAVGYLWTPGYWAFGGGYYGWHPGYWGLHVGFYGGVNYGFGYGGVGYVGGGWVGGAFRYNTAVTSVNTSVVNNTYVDKTVTVNNTNTTNVSYNGGPNGVVAHPTAEEQSAAAEQHIPPTAIQRQNVRTASQNRNYFASVNKGNPQDAAVAAPLNRTNRPASFAPVTAADRANRNPNFRSPGQGQNGTQRQNRPPGSRPPHPAPAAPAPHDGN